MKTSRWGFLGLALAALACGPSSSGLDRDGDGVESANDCDDANPAAWQLVSVHADADRDGRGAGPLIELCAGAETPEGYSASADDCAEGNPNAWQLLSLYGDGDYDGRGAGPLVELCAGAAMPSGYSSTATDCDDADPDAWETEELYADGDGDAVGAGPLTTVCRGTSLPEGWSQSSTDCAPDDGARWQELAYSDRDADGDGRTSPEVGIVCSGQALAAGYALTPTGADCDDGDRTAWVLVGGYLDADGDGIGAGAAADHCTGGGQPSGWSAQGNDCAPAEGTKFQLLPYRYRDADGDLATVYTEGQVCSGYGLPAGYGTAAGPRWDCDDERAELWQQLSGYADQDGDGVGAGSSQLVCTGTALPAGYAPTTGDCAIDDSTRWRTYAYSYRDADGDGSAVYSSGTLCLGDTTPPGYSSSGTAIYDCDDTNPAIFRSMTGYADEDADGVGAGPFISNCTAGTLPVGQQPTSTDCAPADGSRWQTHAYAGLDEDGDGVSTRTAGSLCAGAALPPPYVAVASGNDCNDGDVTLWRWVVLYPDHDGDGIGAPPRVIPCLGADLPPGLVPWGWDSNDGDPLVQADAGAGDDLLDLLW